jgi:two-component system, NarL family, response regulator LiaR
MNTNKLKIIIVDDNATFRKAVKLFLIKELNCEIINEASNGAEFLKLKNILNADLVLIDIQMPEIDGLSATKSWCLYNSNTKVIALTMFTEKVYLLPMIEAGFKGCIYKINFFSTVLEAIDKVMKGGLYFEKEMPVIKNN